MNILEKLNPMQREAALQIEGPVLILAGAGSGKTRVLTHRTAYMIENGINPFNILSVTFTNKAAAEMRERTEKLTPLGSEVWISTFHSMCVRMLRREIQHLNYDKSFTIYDADDAERLIRECIKELNINEKQFSVKSVMYEISEQKNELILPEQCIRSAEQMGDYRKSIIGQVYVLYQKKLKKSNALDFDDIIFKTVELFTLNPIVLSKYQERFKYIMVDEYQDTNRAQYKLVRLLADKYENICVVGDDDQSIYGWRGADVRNILGFEKDFSNAKVVKLEQNYRSTEIILGAANAVIANNTSRTDKKLWTELSGGENISFQLTETELDEAKYIADTITKGISDEKGYKDYAVLYRTNAQSRPIEEQFIYKNIPYRIFGGIRFYERMEIKDILAYLKLIANPYDGISLRRIINVPRRGIGETTIDKIFEYAEAHDMAAIRAFDELDNIGLGARKQRVENFIELLKELMEFAAEHTVIEILEYIYEKTGYKKELELEGTDTAKGRLENIQSLDSKAAEFMENSEDKTLVSFLEQVALVADIDNYKEDMDTVVLMTLHSSKGLEFPYVFISGFEEGVFPSYRSIISSSKSEIEEERRLCYVGITRARERLMLSAASRRRQNGRIVYNLPSRFYNEIPKTCFRKKQENVKQGAVKTANKFASKGAQLSAKADIQQRRPYSAPIPSPKNLTLDFKVGDMVQQMKYGQGIVQDIKSAGADYEVTVEFAAGAKKFMAHLANLKKVQA